MASSLESEELIGSYVAKGLFPEIIDLHSFSKLCPKDWDPRFVEHLYEQIAADHRERLERVVEQLSVDMERLRAASIQDIEEANPKNPVSLKQAIQNLHRANKYLELEAENLDHQLGAKLERLQKVADKVQSIKELDQKELIRKYKIYEQVVSQVESNLDL